MTLFSDGDHRRRVKFQGVKKATTFIPKYGSEISKYKTKMCPFSEKYGDWKQGKHCIFAHDKWELRKGKFHDISEKFTRLDPQQPIPIRVKEIYERINRNKRSNRDFDSRTMAKPEKRNFIFEEEDYKKEDYGSKYVQPDITEKKNMHRESSKPRSVLKKPQCMYFFKIFVVLRH